MNGPFDDRMVRVIASPLTAPGRDRCLRRVEVAGPTCEGDRRVYLSRETLEKALDAARSSLTGRAQLDRAGVEVALYEDAAGHRYEVWTLTGLGPKPEPLPAGLVPLVG